MTVAITVVLGIVVVVQQIRLIRERVKRLDGLCKKGQFKRLLVHLESDLLLKPLEDIEPIGDWTKALDKVAELRISHQRLVVMQDECDHDRHEADRQRNPRAVDHPAEDVAPVLVGAEQVERGRGRGSASL